MTTVEKNSREKERRGGVRNRGFFNVIWRPAVSQQLHQPAAHAFYRLFLWRYNIIWKIKNSPIQVVDYVGVLVFPHHQNFIDDQLFLGLLLQVHLLNGHLRRQKKNSCVPHNNKMCERLCERTETNRTMFHLLAGCNVNGSVHSARGSARTHGKSSQ